MAPVEWKEIEGERWFKFNSSFDRFKYFYGHWVSIILFFVVITLIIWVGVYLYQNKTAFFENPLAYGVKQIEKRSGGIVSCSCFINREDSPSIPFMLDREGVYDSKWGKK